MRIKYDINAEHIPIGAVGAARLLVQVKANDVQTAINLFKTAYPNFEISSVTEARPDF